MASRLDPDSFGFLIGDISRLVRTEVDRLIGEAGLGLTPGEARTLSNAARAGSVRQNVLAERMGIEAMTVCAYLDRLEARGLVHRTVDPADRRAKLVHLTDAADDILERLRPLGAETRRLAAAGLEAGEWDMLQHLLKRVRASLAANRSEGPARGDAA